MTTQIFVSDLHINSTVAVCPPVVNLDDGGTYHASRAQHWLIECWQDFIDKVRAIQGRKVMFVGGDLGELDTKRRSNQLITMNKATIEAMVLDTILPLVDVVDQIVFIRGTMAHTGKSQWLEEAVARQITTAVHNKAKNTASWYQFQGEVDGMRLDVAHHAPMGRTPLTRANSANKLAEKATWHYRVNLDIPAPHFVFRSHNHKKADSTDNFPVRAIFLPCWSLITEFGYRLGAELELADIGGFISDRNFVLYKARENRRIWVVKI